MMTCAEGGNLYLAAARNILANGMLLVGRLL
jgi:hypothetical protein